MSLIAISTDLLMLDEGMKSIWMADKRGEVGGLRVERALGIQCRSPPTQLTPKFTSWRFGNLEKSKDCSGTPE